MGRGLPVIICGFLLTGCALPVPLQMASWAVDGFTFLSTDKTIADHGISAIVQKDCALWRGLKGDDICSQSDESGAIAIASAEDIPTQDPQSMDTNIDIDVDVATLADFETASGGFDDVPDVAIEPVAKSGTGKRLMISSQRVWSDQREADLYYVIGSFAKRDNARRMLDKYQDLGPAVMASHLDGVEIYRVAVGPFSSDQKRQVRVHLKQVGIDNAWAMRVNYQDWTLAGLNELSTPAPLVAEVAALPAKPDVVNPQPAELTDNPKYHLVIGSFSNANNARKFADSKAGLSPRVLAFKTDGGWRHRVVIGPFAKVEAVQTQQQLTLAGLANIWPLDLSPQTVGDDTQLADAEIIDQTNM